MTTLKEIDARLAAPQAQREEIRKNELNSTIDKVRSLVVEYGLTNADIFSQARSRLATTRAKVAAKYRDPISGSTWTGRGRAPKWVQGQDRQKFAIKE